MKDEKRSNIRVSVNLPAKWDAASGRGETRIEDISLGGCFVKTTSHVDLSQKISLEIHFPSAWIRFDGVVVFYQPGIGFGLQFDQLSEEQEVAVMQLL